MNSHFVRCRNKDYKALRLELKNVRLEWYFPDGVVVKEGFDFYSMIAEIIPNQTVGKLRSDCVIISKNI